jgi:hypothetical protein
VYDVQQVPHEEGEPTEQSHLLGVVFYEDDARSLVVLERAHDIGVSSFELTEPVSVVPPRTCPAGTCDETVPVIVFGHLLVAGAAIEAQERTDIGIADVGVVYANRQVSPDDAPPDFSLGLVKGTHFYARDGSRYRVLSEATAIQLQICWGGEERCVSELPNPFDANSGGPPW